MSQTVPKRATLQDVANAAKCSLSTASTVLNRSKGNSQVSSATLKRIMEVARRLNYHPNLNARKLASQRYDDVIGVTLDSHAPFLYRDIVSEFEKLVSQNGLFVMIGMLHNDFEQIRKYVNVFLGSGIRRVFCLTHAYPEFGAAVPGLFENFDQVVFFDKPLGKTRFPYIASDDFDNYRRAVAYLLKNGRRRIYHLRNHRNDSCYQLALNGFLAAYEDAGLVPPEEPFFHCNPDFFTSEEDAQKAVIPLLEKKPDALMLHDDESAFWTMRVLFNRGIRVPEDIALFSGNLWRFSRCGTLSLAGISFKPSKISRLALDIFLGRTDATETLVPAEILPGDSCR